MELPIFHVDAFTDRVFAGNPAAVVILKEWLPDATMQAIAAENNLSETAFVVTGGAEFGLRWFTPTVEVDLCGHATLASAAVLFRHGYARTAPVVFRYAEGTLSVGREGDLLVMDFPARIAEPAAPDAAIAAALGAAPRELHRAYDALAVFATQQELEALRPEFAALERCDVPALIATAPGRDCDFASRYFAPRYGIPEDPVTGSAHCTLIPYWSRRLGRKRLHARQMSRRGGELFCEDRGARVTISGRAVLYLKGTITM